MPELAASLGIVIRIYYDEHNPPHFHAVYGREEAQIGIDPIVLLEGNLPNRALSMTFEWAALHQRELSENWKRLRSDQTARKLPPLR